MSIEVSIQDVTEVEVMETRHLKIEGDFPRDFVVRDLIIHHGNNQRTTVRLFGRVDADVAVKGDEHAQLQKDMLKIGLAS